MCDCKDPCEHAEHLRQEKQLFDRMFPQPIVYTIWDRDADGNLVETEISRDEFNEILRQRREVEQLIARR